MSNVWVSDYKISEGIRGAGGGEVLKNEKNQALGYVNIWEGGNKTVTGFCLGTDPIGFPFPDLETAKEAVEYAVFMEMSAYKSSEPTYTDANN